MTWYVWLIGGLVLLALELASPGAFVAFFFGVSAIIVGALAALGLAESDWVAWLLFSLLSVLSLLVLRAPLRALMERRRGTEEVGRLEGASVVALEDFAADGSGRVELQGTTWIARLVAGSLAKGQRATVERVEGLTLWVRAN